MGQEARLGLKLSHFRLSELWLVGQCWFQGSVDGLALFVGGLVDLVDGFQVVDGLVALWQETLDRVAPFPGRYVLRRGFSTVVATDFADGSMDFVYLDALHSYRDGMNDILAWWPKVEWGLGEEWSESALALVRGVLIVHHRRSLSRSWWSCVCRGV